jgi:hypothetical protein
MKFPHNSTDSYEEGNGLSFSMKGRLTFRRMYPHSQPNIQAAPLKETH